MFSLKILPQVLIQETTKNLNKLYIPLLASATASSLPRKPPPTTVTDFAVSVSSSKSKKSSI